MADRSIEDILAVINAEDGITKLSDYYRGNGILTETTSIVFCQHCGTENIIMPSRNTADIIYCAKCGEVIG
jgi:hypothetical protein